VAVVGAFRLSAEKRPDLFVETFARAQARFPRLRAVHMGEGPAAEAFDALVAARGLSGRVQRLGNRRDLPKVMSAMDVLLHTALWEGTPNVVLEAQQLGLPVVATDAGGSADAVADGVTGFCVPKHDEALLAQRLCDIVSDLATWRVKAKAGPAFVSERFGLARMVDETLACQTVPASQAQAHPKPASGVLAALFRSLAARRASTP
jgi:glycosyltransferase involved in cell wall biosynthesis